MNATPPISVARERRVVARASGAATSAISASIAGQQREQRVLPADQADEAGERAEQRPLPSERPAPCVAAHIQMKPATAAIDGACVMLGSLTMYQSMKEPPTTSAVAGAATRRAKNSARQPR